MASATPDLRLPTQPKLVLITPIHGGMARLSLAGSCSGYIPRWFTRQKAVTHPGTNRPSVEYNYVDRQLFSHSAGHFPLPPPPYADLQ